MPPSNSAESVERDSFVTNNVAVVQFLAVLFCFIFYGEIISVVIAVNYIIDQHYYWFAFQMLFYFSYAIFLLWTSISFLVYIVFFQGYVWLCMDGEDEFKNDLCKIFRKNTFLIPLKQSIYEFWPLSPLLGINYLISLCSDKEIRDGIKAKVKIRLYITMMHEFIRSGGSIILQSYSLREGHNINKYLMIASISINFICFLKYKIIYSLLSIDSASHTSLWRKILHLTLMVVEVGAILSSLIAITRYDKILGILAYFSVIFINICYTCLIESQNEKDHFNAQQKKKNEEILDKKVESEGDKSQGEISFVFKEGKGIYKDNVVIMKECTIMIHDYMSLICIKALMIKSMANCMMELLQLVKISILIGFCLYIYICNEEIDALVSACLNLILVVLLIAYFFASAKEKLEEHEKEEYIREKIGTMNREFTTKIEGNSQLSSKQFEESSEEENKYGDVDGDEPDPS
ncbi:unnamed protein product [Moneuplotes crassus]|uniref:Uncharacterized protein n=1 Tax=Euplotes crassus TaxID=5936 RepID=A0AAD1UCR6_EUPCR|nr:unnamed protein product [Moneuplotes crassus]